MVVWLWVGFILLVLFLLALDLLILHRNVHVIPAREALGWTAFWVALALIFNGFVWFIYDHHWLGIGMQSDPPLDGRQAALAFFTAYLVEESLSLDNIFVMAIIFSYFRIPAQNQHRVLFWGILGAQIMRGLMIVLGVELIERFSWTIYFFGGLLLVSAVKLLITRHETIEPEHNPLLRLARRFYPVTHEMHGSNFFVRLADGRKAMTPMFLALLVVESTDVMFAVDSIPACFAVTRDPFIVFTSNIFAILGLRSLYFALAAVMNKFRYMKQSLVFVLAFVGVKMILADHYHIATGVSLAVICGILSVGVAASLVGARREPPDYGSSGGDAAP